MRSCRSGIYYACESAITILNCVGIFYPYTRNTCNHVASRRIATQKGVFGRSTYTTTRAVLGVDE